MSQPMRFSVLLPTCRCSYRDVFVCNRAWASTHLFIRLLYVALFTQAMKKKIAGRKHIYRLGRSGARPFLQERKLQNQGLGGN